MLKKSREAANLANIHRPLEESRVTVLKTLVFCFCTCVVCAQPLFQKKIEGLQAAEGLVLLPDGGSLLAGLRGNCIQILRFDPLGVTMWARQICPLDANADISIGALDLVADSTKPGAFFLLFRKGAFASAPDNLLNLMRFDASGNLLWEKQLWPEKRYGPLSAGTQLAVTPTGHAWAAHAMGFTDPLPDYSQLLVFKTAPDGTPLLRHFYLSDQPAASNGILAENDEEIYIYGTLGTAINDGFVLKINGLGEVIWANRYEGTVFLREGGFFPNGDFLLLAKHGPDFGVCRLAPDGAMVWGAKCADSTSLFYAKVASDSRILLAARKGNAPYFLFQTNTSTGLPDWAKTYEACTELRVTALQPMPNGQFVFAQSSSTGPAQTRLIRADALGQLSAECPFWTLSPPAMLAFSALWFPIPFTRSGVLKPETEQVFGLGATSLTVRDCCPTEYPEARFELPDSVCAGSPFTLRSEGNGCADTWQWQMPGAEPNASQEIDFQKVVCKNAGTYAVVLTETIGTCSGFFSDTLRVIEAMPRDIFPFSDTTVCPGAALVSEPDLSGFTSWVWWDGSTESRRVWAPAESGVFGLLGQDGLCVWADSFRVGLADCGPVPVFAPNVFSPNGDGENDVWEIFLQPGIQVLACTVFDRWGNGCYTSNPGEIPRWDGNVHGKQAAPGVFVWQLRLQNASGAVEYRSGNLSLVR